MAAPLARLGSAFGIAGIAAAAALQAVDGVALKAMVERWAAAASEAEKVALFAATYAVRQTEIGLAAATCLLLGLMAAILGLAFVIDGRVPRWAGILGIAGVSTAASGVVIAYAGFSRLSMAVNMPAVLVLMAWTVALGILDRRGRRD